MCPLQIISYLVEEHEGDQAGEVLASFIVHKQAELTFLTEFGGIEHFLQEQVKLYEGSQPSCARELNIVKAAVKEVAKITQALVMQQRPRMNFGTPGAAVRPAMNFGEAGPSGLQQPRPLRPLRGRTCPAGAPMIRGSGARAKKTRRLGPPATLAMARGCNRGGHRHERLSLGTANVPADVARNARNLVPYNFMRGRGCKKARTKMAL